MTVYPENAESLIIDILMGMNEPCVSRDGCPAIVNSMDTAVPL
jgi:hypothetical protein